MLRLYDLPGARVVGEARQGRGVGPVCGDQRAAGHAVGAAAPAGAPLCGTPPSMPCCILLIRPTHLHSR